MHNHFAFLDDDAEIHDNQFLIVSNKNQQILLNGHGGGAVVKVKQMSPTSAKSSTSTSAGAH